MVSHDVPVLAIAVFELIVTVCSDCTFNIAAVSRRRLVMDLSLLQYAPLDILGASRS